MPDYSHRPLIKKLGIKPGMRACLIQPPPYYNELTGPMPEDVSVSGLEGMLDFIHYFSMGAAELSADFPRLKAHLDKKGMIWISWPKGKSGVKTDLNGNIVRQIGLDTGLVDIKVCSVDEVWSGLKFTYRKSDR